MVEQIKSEIIHTVESKKFGIIGYLVIDRLIGGGSFGGVRIVPDMSLSELQFVARSMTYKNAFIGNKIGGAKAAVIINKENEKYKREILIEFGKSISPYVKNRTYFPVMDMGIKIDELQTIFDSTGIRCNVLSWKNLSHEYTAYSCFYATLCALEEKGISLKDTTFSVQGFGSVGSTYADLMCKAGARLIAFSNKYFGIIDNKGFNNGELDKLLIERSTKGDEFILEQPTNRQVLHNSVLEIDATVLLPASSALAINDENWKRINADIIICAANAPMSYDIERLLFKNGKIVVTDFVANCGGILGSIMDNYVDNEIIFHIISTYYKRKIQSLLSQSLDLNKPLVDIVIEEAEKRIDSDYKDIDSSNKLVEYMISKMSNKYMSNKYMSKYETLWS